MSFVDGYVTADGLVGGINIFSILFQGFKFACHMDVDFSLPVGIFLDDLHHRVFSALTGL
jgi:hypothetical protein